MLLSAGRFDPPTSPCRGWPEARLGKWDHGIAQRSADRLQRRRGVRGGPEQLTREWAVAGVVEQTDGVFGDIECGREAVNHRPSCVWIECAQLLRTGEELL